MKIGICADNYKVPLFEKELTAAGFTFEKFPLTEGSTNIRVEGTANHIPQIMDICVRVNSTAVRNKTKEN